MLVASVATLAMAGVAVGVHAGDLVVASPSAVTPDGSESDQPQDSAMPAQNLSDSSVPLATRIKTAKALATSPSPSAVDELLTGLDSRSEPLRAAVLASLKAKKGDSVLLARAADVKRPPASRVAALAGVRVLKPTTAGPTLALLLDDKSEAVREAAAHALCVVGTAGAEAKLIAKISSEPSAKVRSFIAVALGELKTPAAKAAVDKSLQTEADVVVKDALDQAQTRQAQPTP